MRLVSPILSNVTNIGTPIARAIKRLRTNIGMTPDELADAGGVSRSTVYRIEGGEIGDPDLTTLRGLAKALEVTLSEFFLHVEKEGGESLVSGQVSERSASASEEVLLLERLAGACARAAAVSRRAILRVILKEMAVEFRVAAHPTAEGLDRAIERVNEQLEEKVG